jgi:hypothetical protein
MSACDKSISVSSSVPIVKLLVSDKFLKMYILPVKVVADAGIVTVISVLPLATIL